MRNSFPIVEIFPSLSQELQSLLIAEGEPNLAAQVPQLQILDRCRCGDDFCALFHVKPKPKEKFAPGHSNVALNPNQGIIALDVVDGVIATVEILYRNEIRRKLLAEFP